MAVVAEKVENVMQMARDRVETEWKAKLAARQEAGEAIGELTMENMKIAMEAAAKTLEMKLCMKLRKDGLRKMSCYTKKIKKRV